MHECQSRNEVEQAIDSWQVGHPGMSAEVNCTTIFAISDAPWVGFDHFKEFLEDESLGYVIKNTIGMSLIKLIIGAADPVRTADE